MPGGTTAHSRFGVPVPLPDGEARSSISVQSARAKVLRDAALIVVDEATMGRKEMYDLIDVLLRDVMRVTAPELADVPFGGKVILLCGDFRQLCPVVLHAGRAGVLAKTLKQSHLWSEFTLLKMTVNMRVQRLLSTERGERLAKFAQWLLDIGDGRFEFLEVPEEMNIPFDDSLALIRRVYPCLETEGLIADDACILTTLNAHVDDMNRQILNLLPGQEYEYRSADTFGPNHVFLVSDIIFFLDVEFLWRFHKEYMTSMRWTWKCSIRRKC